MSVQGAFFERSRQRQVRRGAERDPEERLVARNNPAAHQILMLQRAAGNRAVADLLRVQRYRTVNQDQVETARGEDERRPRFIVQSDDMVLTTHRQEMRPGSEERQPGSGLRFSQESSDSADLHVAGDNSLAINAAAGEPKDFFASAAAIESANTELAAVNSPIELFTVGHTVTVPAAGDTPRETLSMVQPKLRGEDPPGAGEFAAIGVDICRDMAGTVMAGSISHAVLGTGDSRTRVPIDANSGTTVSGMLKLAEGLGTGDVSLQEAKVRLADVKESPTAGEAYGTALKEGTVAGRAAGLGVNERAKARIGEGYVTQTVPGTDGPKWEYSALGRDPFERDFVWGYHFGAVIAESLDERDQILLENYARKTDLQAGQVLLLARLVEDFRDRLDGIELVGAPALQIGRILNVLDGTAVEAREKWSQFYTQEVQELATLWYFRIVGEEEGQSFHEQMAGSGYFSNPLTLAVAHQQFTDGRLRFKPGVQTPTDADFARNSVKRWTKAARADIHQRVFPGKIHITGYRSQTWSPFTAYKTAGIGGRRAAEVARLFREEDFPDGRIVQTDAGGTTKFGTDNDVVEVSAGT